ncbi:MAG: hypothetical protein ACRBG0_17720 [Lewinella sp.]|uniref:hypothetical protein n=1 Tax=Lewinella sp. TaxID=2004506 RepID=UPI003D6A5BA8
MDRKLVKAGLLVGAFASLAFFVDFLANLTTIAGWAIGPLSTIVEKENLKRIHSREDTPSNDILSLIDDANWSEQKCIMILINFDAIPARIALIEKDIRQKLTNKEERIQLLDSDIDSDTECSLLEFTLESVDTTIISSLGNISVGFYCTLDYTYNDDKPTRIWEDKIYGAGIDAESAYINGVGKIRSRIQM